MSRILVAEDNPMNRELIREMLEARGYEMVEAATGLEALERMDRATPDLVLLDVQMPVLDGYGVIRRLRDDKRFTRLPVVGLTAYAMRGDREKALAAGFTSYVTKPIDFAVLTGEIERLLKG